MTDEMYAKLQQPKPPRSDRPLWISLILVTVISAAILLPMIYMMWYTFHWRDFLSAISSSTTYSYRYHTGLQGTVEDELTTVTDQHMYQLYELLTEHMSKLHHKAPEEDPLIFLTYGDGATLEIWEITLEADPAGSAGYQGSLKQEYGVFWRFTTSDGEVWMYDTDLQSYRNVWILTAPSQNRKE